MLIQLQLEVFICFVCFALLSVAGQLIAQIMDQFLQCDFSFFVFESLSQSLMLLLRIFKSIVIPTVFEQIQLAIITDTVHDETKHAIVKLIRQG